MNVIRNLQAGGSAMKQESDEYTNSDEGIDSQQGGNSGISYKVVHVGADGQLVSTNLANSTPSGVESPSQQQVYIPLSSSSTITDSAPAITQEHNAPSDSTEQSSNVHGILPALSAGQLYVMMSPQEVLSNQRTIAPRTSLVPPKLESIGGRTVRDERRRHTHNEVERRRRDKINNLIVQLSKIVPDCAADPTKQGQVSASSKGSILTKTCTYIQELRNENARLQETVKEVERMTVESEVLRQQLDEMKQENEFLKSQLQQNGININVFPDDS